MILATWDTDFLTSEIHGAFFLEMLNFSQLVKNSLHFVEPECSLPHSHVPATCPDIRLKSSGLHCHRMTYSKSFKVGITFLKSHRTAKYSRLNHSFFPRKI